MLPTSLPVKEPVARPARWSNGAILGPWRLERHIADGAWTHVFLAAPIDSTSTAIADYVIKVIKPEFATDPQVIAMMQREAFLSKRVSHSHLTCVLASHVESPPYFVVLPYQLGSTLSQLITAFERLPPARALWIIRQAAEGLSALHECGWTHGDVKPDNIYVAQNGHVTLCDLGFAQPFSKSRDSNQVLFGTPAYLAPESLNGSLPIGAPSDTYALGVTLFEAITGSRPFAQEDEAELAAVHRSLPPPDPRVIVPQLHPSLCRVLRQMLAKEPLRRPVGAELVELLVDLEIDSFEMRE